MTSWAAGAVRRAGLWSSCSRAEQWQRLAGVFVHGRGSVLSAEVVHKAVTQARRKSGSKAAGCGFCLG